MLCVIVRLTPSCFSRAFSFLLTILALLGHDPDHLLRIAAELYRNAQPGITTQISSGFTARKKKKDLDQVFRDGLGHGFGLGVHLQLLVNLAEVE
jgi:hypothetical protein